MLKFNDIIAHLRQNPYLYIPVAVVLVVFSLYAVYWNVSAGRIEKAFVEWAEQQNENGADVSYGGLKFGGFPYRYSLVVTDFSYGDPLHPRRWIWKMDRLRLAMYVYNTERILADMSGNQLFSFDEQLTVEARAPRRFEYLAHSERAHGSISQKSGVIANVSLVFDDLKVEREGLSAKYPFTASTLEIHARPTPAELADTEKDIDLYLTGTEVVIPTGDQLVPASEELDAFIADLTLINFRDVLTSDLVPTDWADSGGKIKINAIAIDADDYDLLAEGTLGVDNERRLAGEIETRLGKYSALVDRLVEQSVIEKQHAQTVKSVLQILAVTSGDENGRIVAPLRFADGAVQIGPAKIARLRPLY